MSKDAKISLKQDQFARTGSVVMRSADKRQYPVFVRLGGSSEACPHRFPPRPLGMPRVLELCLLPSATGGEESFRGKSYENEEVMTDTDGSPSMHLGFHQGTMLLSSRLDIFIGKGLTHHDAGGEWPLAEQLQTAVKAKVKPTSARSDVILNRFCLLLLLSSYPVISPQAHLVPLEFFLRARSPLR